MMKFAFTTLLIIVLNCTVIHSQQTVTVEDWVNKPSDEELSKPLLILDFWATWCVPCINAMEQTEILLRNYENDVLLVYLSNEPRYTVEKFMNMKNSSFFSAVDTKERCMQANGIDNIPSTLIMGPNGEILWRGTPTQIDANLLNKLLKKTRGEYAAVDRFYTDLVVDFKEEENFSAYSSKGLDIDFVESETSYYYIEDLYPEFYFNGNLSQLVAFINNVPEKDVQNYSGNDKFYTLKCTYESREKLEKVLSKFLKNKLDIEFEVSSVKENTLVMSPTNSMVLFAKDTYDFSENKAKYLASDMDVEIDNASVNEMVNILNNFSEMRYKAEGFDDVQYDWKVHFQYPEFTKEQLENDFNFVVIEEMANHNVYTIVNR